MTNGKVQTTKAGNCALLVRIKYNWGEYMKYELNWASDLGATPGGYRNIGIALDKQPHGVV